MPCPAAVSPRECPAWASGASWDGRDLTSCDPDHLRERIAVIFQDFVHYQLPARENVGFGDLGAMDDAAAISEAARRSGAHDFLDGLPDGYETMLGSLFEAGHELRPVAEGGPRTSLHP